MQAKHIPNVPLRDLSIGAGHLPGLAKAVEEAGEFLQAAGKIIAYPNTPHPDGGGDINKRVQDEVADLLAALLFFTEASPERFDITGMHLRASKKLRRFREWHEQELRNAG